MSNRMLSTLVVGAFASAIGALSTLPAGAEEFTDAQKKIRRNTRPWSNPARSSPASARR